MRLGRKRTHNATAPRFSSPDSQPTAVLASTWSVTPPAASDKYWRALKDLPYVRDWRVLSDSLFLLLSFALGMFWLFTIAFIGALGIGLLVVFVGAPILAALFALVIWSAQLERHRLNVFLGVSIATPYRDFEPSTVPWKRAWKVVRHPQFWRDMWYLLLLTPMGILGLAVVALPVQFLAFPLLFLIGGAALIMVAIFGSFVGGRLRVPFITHFRWGDG